MRPVNPRFMKQFWQQLVFDQHSSPGLWLPSFVLDNPSPNVYIRLGDRQGRRVVSVQQRDHIQRAVPALVR